MTDNILNQRPAVYFALLSLSLVLFAYHPGLGGTFVFDDFHNIVLNWRLHIVDFSLDDLWQAAVSGDSGPLLRPLSMLSFAINHMLTGLDPWWMKLTNLGVHLFNGALVFWLVREILSLIYGKHCKASLVASYFAAGLWLLHPINVTAVAYIVQRMTSLSATFTLLAIVCYLRLRKEPCQSYKGYLLSGAVFLCFLLGVFSKETGILLSVYLFVIELCIYNFSKPSLKLKSLWVILAAPWFLAPFYFMYNPESLLGGYAHRDFTLWERLLTESRILIDYMRLILIPSIQDMGLYNDDIITSSSIFSPITTFFSLCFLLGLLVFGFCFRRRAPLFCLGIFWFLGGHVLESTIVPLELVFLHRNYLPAIGVLISVAAVLIGAYKRYKFNDKAVLIFALSVLLLFSYCTRALVYQWSGDLRFYIIEALNKPDSYRANLMAGHVFKFHAQHAKNKEQREKHKAKAFEYFEKLHKLKPDDMSSLLSMLEVYVVLNEFPPRDFIDNLIKRAEQKVGFVSVNLKAILNVYIDCFYQGNCNFSQLDFENLLNAWLNNKELSVFVKRDILLSAAKYLATIKGDFPAAIEKIIIAYSLDDSLEIIAILARYYEKAGNIKEMHRTLRLLGELDKLGLYSNFIKERQKKYNL